MAYVIDKQSPLAVAELARSGEIGEIEREFSNLTELVLSDSELVRHQECAMCHRPCCPDSVFMFRWGDDHVLLARAKDVSKDLAAAGEEG